MACIVHRRHYSDAYIEKCKYYMVAYTRSFTTYVGTTVALKQIASVILMAIHT